MNARWGDYCGRGRSRRNAAIASAATRFPATFQCVSCGFRKVRYRGIAKNGAQVFALLALANLYLVRSRLASAA